VLARYLGKEMEAQLGKPVIILNKPGAGTIIGAQAVTTAPPDGYTLLLSSNSNLQCQSGGLRQAALRSGDGFRADRDGRGPCRWRS